MKRQQVRETSHVGAITEVVYSDRTACRRERRTPAEPRLLVSGRVEQYCPLSPVRTARHRQAARRHARRLSVRRVRLDAIRYQSDVTVDGIVKSRIHAL